MILDLVYFLHYGLILLFGILLSFAFCGIRVYHILLIGALFVVCGSLQLGGLMLWNEAVIWKLYPLITHLPLVALLYFYYHQRISTALAAVSSAYLCCQPAKWCGLIVLAITEQPIAEYLTRIATLIVMSFVILRWISDSLARIFHKDNRSVFIFGMVPLVYYLFDYSMGIYTNNWIAFNQVALEFLPFFLCFVYLMFCFVYYKQYEQNADAQRSEQIIRITVEQQTKELEAVKRSDTEVRMLRHDMRMILSSLGLCIDEGDLENAKQIIRGYISRIDGTTYQRFCTHDMINYVLSDYHGRCKAMEIPFSYTIDVETLKVDEIQFCSILSNALDNALNAQKTLTSEKRNVRLLLKSTEGKLLLSVSNPFDTPPVFVDGLPVSDQKNHGYGTQSIRYLSQRLGGNCQFTVEDNRFITRVIL